MSSDEDDDMEDYTPLNQLTEGNSASETTLPLNPNTKERYLERYENFMVWKKEKGEKGFSESVFLAYFKDLAKVNKPPTLYSIFSMLKATLKMKTGFDGIDKYESLRAFLKNQSVGYEGKKSKILTSEDIQQFLNQAPNQKYLVEKVALIMGLRGACRVKELHNITTKDVEWHDESTLIVTLRTRIKDRQIILSENLDLVKKYQEIRPTDATTERFFVLYTNGKCYKQPIGLNKMYCIPRTIARYLNLPDPTAFSGLCFRASSKFIPKPRYSAKIEELIKSAKRPLSPEKLEVYLEETIEKNDDSISELRKGAIKIEPATLTDETILPSDANYEDSKESMFLENIAEQDTRPQLEDNEVSDAECSKQLTEAKLELAKLQRKCLEIEIKQKEMQYKETLKQHEFNEQMRRKKMQLMDLRILYETNSNNTH